MIATPTPIPTLRTDRQWRYDGETWDRSLPDGSRLSVWRADSGRPWAWDRYRTLNGEVVAVSDSGDESWPSARLAKIAAVRANP